MTQRVEGMDFSDDEEDSDAVIGYLELLPPLAQALGWRTKEFKGGKKGPYHMLLSPMQAVSVSTYQHASCATYFVQVVAILLCRRLH